MQGLMQDWPLVVSTIIDHAKRWHGDREIVTRTVEGPIHRCTYADLQSRAKKCASALDAMGLSRQPRRPRSRSASPKVRTRRARFWVACSDEVSFAYNRVNCHFVRSDILLLVVHLCILTDNVQ